MTDWQRLNITDEQLEVIAHLTLRADATDEERLREIWPLLAIEASTRRLVTAVQGINRAASEATGKPGQVIAINGDSLGSDVPTPEVYVHVMGEMYVEVR